MLAMATAQSWKGQDMSQLLTVAEGILCCSSLRIRGSIAWILLLFPTQMRITLVVFLCSCLTIGIKLVGCFLNPDARDTELWNDFVSEMNYAKERGTKFSLELTDENPGEIYFEEIRLEGLFPAQDLAIRTSKGATSEGSH